MPIKICEICGNEFKARLSVYRTCGVKCRNDLIAKEKVAKGLVVKECEVCGKEFTRTASQPDSRTCSRKCRDVVSGLSNRRRVIKKCITCGKDFETVESNKDSAKYCSKQCMYDRNKETTKRPCVVCGTLFTSPPSHQHVSTCSTECGYKNRVVLTGEASNFWQGVGLTSSSAWSARYRATKLNATPAWADLEKIQQIYTLCKQISEATGVLHHVDHIVPLQGKQVCGLHVESNLRIISATENISKSNNFLIEEPQ